MGTPDKISCNACSIGVVDSFDYNWRGKAG